MEDFPALVRGNRAFAQQDWSTAISCYTEALEEDEEDITALCNRSAAYYSMELYKTSLKDANSALEIDPANVKALERKGLALAAMGKRRDAENAWKSALMTGGDLDIYMNVLRHLGFASHGKHLGANGSESIQTQTPRKQEKFVSDSSSSSPVRSPPRQEAIQSQPKHAHVHTSGNQNSILLGKKEKKTVQEVEQETSELEYEHESNASNRGVLTISASKSSDTKDPAQVAALAAAQNLIAHGIGNISVDQRIALGYLQVNTGNYKAGIEIFDGMLKEDDKLVAAYLGRGTAYALQGNLTAAAKDFSRAVDAGPNVADAWKRRGQTRAALGFDQEAIKDLTKAASLSPDHECFHQRGIVYHKMMDFRKALTDFRKALNIDGTSPITWNFVGLCENSLGRTREAIIAYERATQLDPNMKEAWANLAQAHRDAGDRQNAEKYFAKAERLDPNYVHCYHLRGLLYYGCGEIRLALQDFSKGHECDRNDKNCFLMKAVCKHSLGDMSGAISEYTLLLKMDPEREGTNYITPGHLCYYQRELAIYLQKRLDVDVISFNADVELDAYFKESYCKRDPTNHPRLCNYTPQKPATSKIPDVKLVDKSGVKEIDELVELSRRFGPLIQLRSAGFLSNLRQHRMCGLAILHMAQQAKAWWQSGSTAETVANGSRRYDLYFDVKGSSKDCGKKHAFGWRDFMDISVKWRQISEPNDPVFWIDLMAEEVFAEGFGLQTPMVTGQMNVVRYYPYFERARDVVKKLIEESGACNVHDQRFMLPPNKIDQLKEAKTCQDLWDVMQQGFYVETPCHSIARPGKIMAGTRITLLQKPPDGFDFTIRTPGTPPRWLEMDKEMAHVWSLLTEEARRQPAPDPDRFTDLALTFYFYWVNFGPLSRGTAACGYIAFFALMLSIGFEVQTSPPEGTQVDWPAILSPTPAGFIEEVRSWIYPSRERCDILETAPAVGEVLATPRRMLEALNCK